jgi:hypothetical protein
MNGLNNDTKYAILTKTPAPEKSMSIKCFFTYCTLQRKGAQKKGFLVDTKNGLK